MSGGIFRCENFDYIEVFRVSASYLGVLLYLVRREAEPKFGYFIARAKSFRISYSKEYKNRQRTKTERAENPPLPTPTQTQEDQLWEHEKYICLAQQESQLNEKPVGHMSTFPTDRPDFEVKSAEMSETRGNESRWSEVRVLAKQFERAIPFCIAAVLNFTNSDQQSVVVNLYLHTSGVAISEKFRELAKKIFCNYDLKFVDLEHEELGDYFMPRPSESVKNFKEMANIAQIIKKNLPFFTDRSNVTAVYPSYKISDHQETDDLCIAVSVLGKGKIPVGEEGFPEELGGYPLDVIEGYFWPASRVEYGLGSGVGIGVRGKPGTGTLGAFLTDGHDYYLLSCNHVLFKQDGAHTAEQTLGDENSGEEDPSEEKLVVTGELESVANDQTAESDLVVERLKDCIHAAEKKLEELRKKGDLETDEKRKLDHLDECGNMEECVNTLRGKLRFMDYISRARERLVELKNEIRGIKSQARVPKGDILIEHPAADDVLAGPPTAEQRRETGEERPAETGNSESVDVANGQIADDARKRLIELEHIIKRIESQVRVPKEGEILIEHPAAGDVITETIACDETIKSGKNELEKKGKYGAEKTIMRIESEIEAAKLRLDELLDVLLPRCIATYVDGFLGNYSHDDEVNTFVDAGIAKLCDDQRDEILAGNYKPFAKPITDEVVLWKDIEQEADGTKFWKFGAATRLTDRGEFFTFGAIFKFGTFCELCAENMFGTSPKSSTQERWVCRTCQREITQTETKHDIWAEDCFLVKSKKDFCADGDSGAVIFDEKKRAWGIIVGIHLVGDSVFSVVCSLDIALQALCKKTGENLRLWTGVAGT